MVENRITYWLQRLPIDGESDILNDHKKQILVKSALETIITSASDDIDLFLNPSQLNEEDLDRVLKVADIEKEIANFFGGSPEFKYGGKEQERRFIAFLETFRTVTSGLYIPEEQDEICNFIKPPADAMFITMTMIGRNHPLTRRIRNAYLPAITSLIQVNVSDEGEITGGKDITHTLFDGSRDASDEIDRLLGA